MSRGSSSYFLIYDEFLFCSRLKELLDEFLWLTLIQEKLSKEVDVDRRTLTEEVRQEKEPQKEREQKRERESTNGLFESQWKS
jgi:hypothetical protein